MFKLNLDRSQRATIWVMLVLGISLLAGVLYFTFIIYLRHAWASCPPACQKADFRQADLRQTNLNQADLSEANLAEANLAGMDLQEANLYFAILKAANLRGANLRGAGLRGSYLSGADLSQADLRQADLGGARLDEANLFEADLRGANFTGADFAGANLRVARLDETTQLSPKWRLVWEIVNQDQVGRYLVGADLSQADLGEAAESLVPAPRLCQRDRRAAARPPLHGPEPAREPRQIPRRFRAASGRRRPPSATPSGPARNARRSVRQPASRPRRGRRCRHAAIRRILVRNGR
jgi:hypothetical protein